MADDLLSTLTPWFGCVIQRTPDGLQLSGVGRPFMNAAAITPRTYGAPLTIRTIAKTDSTNLRLFQHIGEIILKWECSVRELRVHDPHTGGQHGIEGAGFITAGEWHEVVWEIDRHAMQLTVDGSTRYACAGDYSAVESAVGIGPCFGSTVTVREFSVTAGE